jgi:trigger factor
MEISVEATSELERKMTIAVPSVEVDSVVDQRLQEAARNVRLNGFRKGKVPLKVVRNRFGKGVRQEVIGELMNRSYYEALSEKKIRPAGQPTIETTSTDEGHDLEFTATFEVYPEIELPEFAGLEVEKLVAEVTDADIDQMIETLREQRHSWQEVDREAADGDMVNIDYVGRRDDEEFQGGKAEGSSLVIGSGRMIPGFEQGLVGARAGDIVTLKLTFPEKYHNSELAGKDADFHVTVNKVSEKVKPELDDEFFASFGIEEGGVDAFREEVAQNMERELKGASRSKVKVQIAESLLKACAVTAPKALVDGEVANLRQQALQRMGAGASQQIDESLLPDELFREQAERRVTSGLIIGEIIAKQGITPDADKVREAVEEIASTYESPDDVVNWYYSNQEQMAGIENSVLEDQAFDYILDQAKVVEKQVSYEDAIKAETAGAESSADPAEEGDKPEADKVDNPEDDQ